MCNFLEYKGNIPPHPVLIIRLKGGVSKVVPRDPRLTKDMRHCFSLQESNQMTTN